MKESKTASNKRPEKRHPTIGVCGLDCGLCPRYYTEGPSRCPGCAGPGFFEKHPTCSFITCCVKNKNLEVCSECPDFPCAKNKTAGEYEQVKESSSYPSYKKAVPNLLFIKQHGIRPFMEQQEKRIKWLEIMIKNYDEGRSRSFFCKAAIFLDLASLKSSLDRADRKMQTEKIQRNDIKSKAKIIRAIINEMAPGAWK
jgi:hypothetical protein